MKNIATFIHIEERSSVHESTRIRVQAAYYTWLGNKGHESMLSICQELKANYSEVVDFAVEMMKKEHPYIKFPAKRPVITPEFDLQAMARIESACYIDPDEAPTFELFYYLANPKNEQRHEGI